MPCEDVVYRNSQTKLLARGNKICDVRLKRRVSSNVLNHKSVVDIYSTFVGCSIKSKKASLLEMARYVSLSLVEHPPNMVPDLAIHENVVVAGRHRALKRS